MEDTDYEDIECCPECGSDEITCNASEYFPEEDRVFDHFHCFKCRKTWASEEWQ